MYNSPYNNNTVWFEGVVENRLDPLEIGRVQVRVFGIHTDNTQKLPSSDLHWMSVLMPVTSASNSGIGETPNLIEGSSVFGIFRDGDSKQDGLVLGSVIGIPQQDRILGRGFCDNRINLSVNDVPGKPNNIEYSPSAIISDLERFAYPNRLDEPDLSRLSRNHNINSDSTYINKNKSAKIHQNIPLANGNTFSEPTNQYSAKYPYNIAKETESGHVFELDDTPKHERVHLYHRSGSHIEFLPNGDFIEKSVNDRYELTHGNSYEHVSKSKHITIDNGTSLFVNAKGGKDGLELKVGSGGSITINVISGDVNLNVTGNVNQNVSGDYSVNVGGNYSVNATRIDLNL